MADKKVDRTVRLSGGPVMPTESVEAAPPQHGTAGTADLAHDKGKASLLEKFRAREEQYHRDHPSQANAEAGVDAEAEVAAQIAAEPKPEGEPSAEEGSA
jgi:hypothetical protein